MKCTDIIIADDLSPIQDLLQGYSSIVVISDDNVYEQHGKQLKDLIQQQKIPIHNIVLFPGEQAKTLDSAMRCWNEMVENGADRRSLVIGLGGGVITDIAGFVAGCFMRGVDVIHIPTTLLGMVDASIGGKTGVNLPLGKNLVGVFHIPKAVLIVPGYLDTMPQREFCAGLAEVIKAGMIDNEEFLVYLERHIHAILRRDEKALEHILKESTAIKAAIAAADAKEKDIRAILNYGHTFAHAIETATNFNIYLHGEAVSIGMSCAAHVSHILGLIDFELVTRQDHLCRKAGLPVVLPDVPSEKLVSLMRKDKKAVSGKISLILCKQIGHMFKQDNVDESLILHALTAKREYDKASQASFAT